MKMWYSTLMLPAVYICHLSDLVRERGGQRLLIELALQTTQKGWDIPFSSYESTLGFTLKYLGTHWMVLFIVLFHHIFCLFVSKYTSYICVGRKCDHMEIKKLFFTNRGNFSLVIK